MICGSFMSRAGPGRKLKPEWSHPQALMTDLPLRTTFPKIEDRILGRSQTYVAAWLWSLAALVFAMVIVGGATRLTQSGLSITEWKPLSGVIPPLSAAAWQAEFQKYKEIPQYTRLFPDMQLADFKVIFFWEWSHRLLGRLIGLVLVGPLVFFWWKRWLPPGFKLKLLALLGLGGFQGFIGWWMVRSGLAGRVEVAQERLAIHLVLASITFALLVWFASSLQTRPLDKPGMPVLRWLAAAMIGIVLLQIGLGGLVAGLRAGLTYNTWPLMDGHFIPPRGDLALLSPVWANLVDNVTMVQFQHRMAAYGLFVLALVQLLATTRYAPQSRAAMRAWIFAGLVMAQASLGILTLVLVVPLPIALLHQAFAMLVLGMAVIHCQSLTARG